MNRKADDISLPYIVTLDAVLNPHENASYEPIIKRVPDVLDWTFEQLVDYMVQPMGDEYNIEPLTLAEQNLAEMIESMVNMTGTDPNATYQIFIPDSGEGIIGPFSPSQKVGKTVSFSREEEYLTGGDVKKYMSLCLRIAMYDIGGQ